jgi:WD40 repeat protein
VEGKMMNRNYLTVSVSFCLFFLVGCSCVIGTPIVSTPSPTGALVSAIFTPTPTLMPAGEERCPDITSSLPENIASGKLILFDHDQRKLVVLDLTSGKRSKIIPETEQALSYAISADGRSLVYESQTLANGNKRLVVMNSLGKQIVKRPWADRWFKIAYWLDAERVVIQMYPDENSNLLAGNHDRLIVFNPFTSQEQMLVNRFPELFGLEYPMNYKGAGLTIYNPALDRAVFAGYTAFHMADMENEVILASIPTIYINHAPVSSPQWSPDGDHALVAAGYEDLDFMIDELYIIDSNGWIERLTHFIDNSSSAGIGEFSWSPDGKRISMLFSTSPSQFDYTRLALLDPITHRLTAYCLQANIYARGFRKNLKYFYDDQVYSGVVWSPFGDQLIIENRLSENESNIILLDIENDLGYMLIESQNLQPIGWMVDP